MNYLHTYRQIFQLSGKSSYAEHLDGELQFFHLTHEKRERGLQHAGRWEVPHIGREEVYVQGGETQGVSCHSLRRLSGSSGSACRAPETLRWWLWPITQDAMFPNHITYIAVNSGDKGLKGEDHSCLIKKKNQTNQTELQPGDHIPARVGALAWWGSALSLTQLNPRPCSCFQSPLIT